LKICVEHFQKLYQPRTRLFKYVVKELFKNKQKLLQKIIKDKNDLTNLKNYNNN
jgi:hypothetical protein